jgi:hypothetical protein
VIPAAGITYRVDHAPDTLIEIGVEPPTSSSQPNSFGAPPMIVLADEKTLISDG